MEIKFKDIIKSRKSSCKRCTALVYTSPCDIDENLAKHLTSFGEPVYDLDVVKFLQIETSDKYIVEAKLGKNQIKFSMPKELEYTDWNKTTRKLEFEIALRNWLEEILGTKITF